MAHKGRLEQCLKSYLEILKWSVDNHPHTALLWAYIDAFDVFESTSDETLEKAVTDPSLPFPGTVLWTCVVHFSRKTPSTKQSRQKTRKYALLLRTWAQLEKQYQQEHDADDHCISALDEVITSLSKYIGLDQLMTLPPTSESVGKDMQQLKRFVVDKLLEQIEKHRHAT